MPHLSLADLGWSAQFSDQITAEDAALRPARLASLHPVAVQALTADSYLTRALGASFCNEFTKLKTSEWEAYSLQVSDWELQRYANTS